MQDDSGGTDEIQPKSVLFNKVSAGFIQFVCSVQKTIRSFAMSGENAADSAVVLLGQHYQDVLQPEFKLDFSSRPWMTYRLGYPPIKPSNFQSDMGWGCMLRSGQMLLANTLMYHFLGREWRVLESDATFSQYTRILSWFFDSNASPYSIHRIALLGKQFDKEIGEWFGPSTISQVLRMLVENHKESQMALYVASDGVIYQDEVKSTCMCSFSNEWKSVLILIPLRLGIEKLNPVYIPSLKAVFDMPQCVGVAGGKPNSSFFFLGYSGEQAIYLDPHFMRPAIKVKDTSSYSLQDLDTYRCTDVRMLSLASLDPSMVVGFYCKTQSDYIEFCQQATSKLALGKTPLFTFQETTPAYSDADILTDDGFL